MIPSGNPMFLGSRNRLEALPGPKTAKKDQKRPIYDIEIDFRQENLGL